MITVAAAQELVSLLTKHRTDQGFYQGRAFELKSARRGPGTEQEHKAQAAAGEASRKAAKAVEQELREALEALDEAFQTKMEDELL